MREWQTKDKRVVFEAGKWLTVESHTVELPDGQVIEDWAWIKTPDFVNVVIVTEDEQFVLFRQTKYAVEGTSLAPVGGYIEPDEDPLDAAKREVLEETGYRSSLWFDLGEYAVDGNRGAGKAHFFLAMRAKKKQEPNADDLEDQELILMNGDEIEKAIFGGEFKVLPWVAIHAQALMYIERYA